MQIPRIDISPSAQLPPAAHSSFATVRFALLCTLLLLVALWLEPWLAPLCRVTAVQVGALLDLAGFTPKIQGDLITLSGFTVRIVTECTPLYASLLYGAFVLAQPASLGRTLAGLLLGVSLISAVNLLRIAFVTAAGTVVAPILFDILHVYLGQVVMLLLVVAAALFWLRWSATTVAPFPFLLRSGLLATLFFIPWLAVNRLYVEQLDTLVALLFSQLYPGYQLLTPRPFAIYNHTFAVPLFLALLLADGEIRRWRKLAAIIGGVGIIACWHALFRVSHVIWTAFDVPEISPFHQAIYLFGQFLLPFLLWFWLAGRTTLPEKRLPPLPVKPAILALLLALCCSSPAEAEPVVLIHPSGRGGFSIKADNLNRVIEAEIRVDYKSEETTPPQVNGAGLGAQATLVVQADNPGTFTIRLKSSKPLSGHVLLATAQIQGSVTFLTAWLRNEKGMVESPRISIKNPSEDELSALAERRKSAPVPVAAKPAVTAPLYYAPAAATKSESSVSSPVASVAAVASPEPDGEESRPMTYSRRKSVLELFNAYSGERTPAAMAQLFERNDDIFHQEPPLLLSDGTAALRLTVRVNNRSKQAPQFIISKGRCVGLEIGEAGVWVLEIVPEQGSLTSSVTVLSGSEMIEFPLAVAPPLELFDAGGAGVGEADYVVAANGLVGKIVTSGKSGSPK